MDARTLAEQDELLRRWYEQFKADDQYHCAEHDEQEPDRDFPTTYGEYTFEIFRESPIVEAGITALQSQWVTITDDPGTLPGIGQRVWVVIGGFVQVTPAHFNGEEWEWLNDAGNPAPRNLVSHWQDYAVPSPPKADSSLTK